MTEEEQKSENVVQDNQFDKDQRQLNLLNDSNYGIILCFLEKFKSVLDLPKYSYQRLEDHLLNTRERIAPRLIDFHFILLKRLSLAKNTQREKFDSIITRFAYKFDLNDGDHLTATGYLQADINIKARILKNLLEGQFDLNEKFSKTLIDKPAREIKSTPLGRDRFGVSYWIFMDTDCFVRLFREDVDLDRTWCNIAKNREELENIIKLLITDSVVRKKFADWVIDYEPFATLESTNEFEKRYLPPMTDVKDENSIKQEEENEEKELSSSLTDDEKVDVPIKRKRGRPKVEVEIKKEEIEAMSTDEEKIQTPNKRKRGRPKTVTTPIKKEDKEEQEEAELMSSEEEKVSEPMKKKRGRPRNSIVKSVKEEVEPKRKSDRQRSSVKPIKAQIEVKEEEITPNRRGRKRKTLVEDHIDEENEKPTEEPSIRRSSRARKAPTIEPTSVLTSKTNTQLPSTKKKRSANGKTKSSRRGRKSKSRRNVDDEFCLSNSSSDEHLDYLSEDEYNSDDYLPNETELEQDEHFFELDEDHLNNGEEQRTAKTAQDSTVTTNCYVCSKSDRPDILLLCDACDDAYHIDCLRPKLLSVPDGDWFCPLCEHKKLSINLIEKLKELLINYNLVEQKRFESESKRNQMERKIKPKEYSSDESLTASETEDLDTDALHADESMLSVSQTNENSNISSTFFDDSNKNISQRGRHRRTRFDMNKMLNGDDDDEDNDDDDDDDGGDDDKDEEKESSSDDDDEYIEHSTPMMNFDLQIPKKMTRLLNQRYRPIARNDQRILPKPIAPRLTQQAANLNEKLGSPIIYINGEHNSHQIKSVITNSNQTLKIVRRWNDVQRRNKLRTTNTTTTNNNRFLQETTSDCADENSVFCPDDASPPRSNESNSNQDLRDDESTIIRSKITLVQPTNLVPTYKSSTKNLVKKTEVNFDRLTRDIQYAVSEANTVPKAIDQQQIKRIQKTNFSPYLTKVALRPLPVLLPKPAGIGYKIFKSKDPPSSTTDLSNIILTPSSSSSLLDGNDEQTSSNMPS